MVATAATKTADSPLTIVSANLQACLAGTIPLRSANFTNNAVIEAMRLVTYWQIKNDSELNPGGALTVLVRPDPLTLAQGRVPREIVLYIIIPSCGEASVRERAEALYQHVYDELVAYR